MNSSLPVLECCDGCGACCRTVTFPPFRIDASVNEALESGVPQHLLEEFLPYWSVRFSLDASHCLWFDEQTRRCRHYELRPQACREFEINSRSCQAVRTEFASGVAPRD
jgi:Fe-S-cluster containining protein